MRQFYCLFGRESGYCRGPDWVMGLAGVSVAVCLSELNVAGMKIYRPRLVARGLSTWSLWWAVSSAVREASDLLRSDLSISALFFKVQWLFNRDAD